MLVKMGTCNSEQHECFYCEFLQPSYTTGKKIRWAPYYSTELYGLEKNMYNHNDNTEIFLNNTHVILISDPLPYIYILFLLTSMTCVQVHDFSSLWHGYTTLETVTNWDQVHVFPNCAKNTNLFVVEQCKSIIIYD